MSSSCGGSLDISKAMCGLEEEEKATFGQSQSLTIPGQPVDFFPISDTIDPGVITKP